MRLVDVVFGFQLSFVGLVIMKQSSVEFELQSSVQCVIESCSIKLKFVLLGGFLSQSPFYYPAYL